MPGWRSSGGRPGWTSTRAVGRAEVGDDGGAVVGAGTGPHLEVGGGDLVVRARHGDEVGLVGRGEPPCLGRAPDQDHPVDLDDLAAGEHQPGDRAGDAGRRRLPGDAGLRRRELLGVVVAGAGHAVVVGRRRRGCGRDRRLGDVGHRHRAGGGGPKPGTGWWAAVSARSSIASSTGSGSGSGSAPAGGSGLLGRRGHVGRPRRDDHRARLGSAPARTRARPRQADDGSSGTASGSPAYGGASTRPTRTSPLSMRRSLVVDRTVLDLDHACR